jgi:SAM-dependent methyltransferase
MRYHDFFTERIASHESVLEVGCGIGALAYDIASKCGAQVTGIDHSEPNIAVARKRFNHRNLTYVVGDAFRDLPSTHYDVVVLSNLLEHLQDRIAFLNNVHAAITPNRWLIRVPVFDRDWRVPLKKELGVEWRLDPTHCTEYTIESFAEEIAAASLAVTSLEVRWGEIWSELRLKDT